MREVWDQRAIAEWPRRTPAGSSADLRALCGASKEPDNCRIAYGGTLRGAIAPCVARNCLALPGALAPTVLSHFGEIFNCTALSNSGLAWWAPPVTSNLDCHCANSGGAFNAGLRSPVRGSPARGSPARASRGVAAPEQTVTRLAAAATRYVVGVVIFLLLFFRALPAFALRDLPASPGGFRITDPFAANKPCAGAHKANGSQSRPHAGAVFN